MTAPTTEQVREAVERLRAWVGEGGGGIPGDDIRLALDALDASEKEVDRMVAFAAPSAPASPPQDKWEHPGVLLPELPASPETEAEPCMNYRECGLVCERPRGHEGDCTGSVASPEPSVTPLQGLAAEMAKQASLGHKRYCVGVHESGEAEWVDWPEAFAMLAAQGPTPAFTLKDVVTLHDCAAVYESGYHDTERTFLRDLADRIERSIGEGK